MIIVPEGLYKETEKHLRNTRIYSFLHSSNVLYTLGILIIKLIV